MSEGRQARAGAAGRARAGAPGGGFTLLEVLLALAIIGLMATGIIGASANLLSSKTTSPDDVFWQAAAAARKSALTSGSDVRLAYDVKTKAFTLEGGSNPRSFPVAAGDDFGVDFIGSQGAAASSLVGGALVETQSLDYATFYGDGTCVPFRIQIRNKGGAHALAIDPWTCARILNPAEAPGSTP